MLIDVPASVFVYCTLILELSESQRYKYELYPFQAAYSTMFVRCTNVNG